MSLSRPRLLAAALAASTLAVYASVGSHGFVSLDDYLYVTENRQVLAGLSWDGVAWAFSTVHANFWHPLTWLSLMLDVQVFGAGPAGFHVTNLLLHLGSTLLLFFAFTRMTGSAYPSAFVAALFAVHPLHVESVAWISERKDVLSAFFMTATVWAYAFYAHGRNGRGGVANAVRYSAVLVLFTFGLMAKPMLVTLPFVLLLLDWWPLGRLVHGPVRIVVEKLPLLALALAAAFLAVLAQRSGGAVASLTAFPPAARVANALTSTVAYLGKMLWPVQLVPFYPYPQVMPTMTAVAAFLLLAAITGAVVVQARRRPYLAVGWCWYLGTLLPVSGIVQVGSHAMADRYTYIPLIGVFIMVAWGTREWAGGRSSRRAVAAAVGLIVVLVSATVARAQVGTWKDSLTLWRHAVAATPGNYFAHNALGLELVKRGLTREAAVHFAESSRLAPGSPNGHNNLGLILAAQGRTDEAIVEYRRALERDNRFVQAHINLGKALHEKGLLEDSIAEFSVAARLSPDSPAANANLGTVLLETGRRGEGLERVRRAVELEPDSGDFHFLYGNALSRVGHLDEAIHHYTETLRLSRNSLPEVRTNLGAALERQGRLDEALARYQEVVRLVPSSAPAHNDVGKVLLRQGRPAEAADWFRKATGLAPTFADAHMNLGSALSDLNLPEEAERAYRKAVDLDPRSANAHFNLASAYAARRRLPDAVRHYEVTLELEGPSAAVHVALGELCERLERMSEAKSHFEAALRLDASDPAAVAGLSRMARIAGRSSGR